MIAKLIASMLIVLALIVHLDDGRGRAPGVGRCGRPKLAAAYPFHMG